MDDFIFESSSLEDTQSVSQALAEAIAERAYDGQAIVIGLTGTLGAGKTTFSSGFCEALGVAADAISSPTFALTNVYSATLGAYPMTIHHFDFYRINDEDELFEIGFEETVALPGVHLVEWSNKFPDSMPHERIEISFQPKGESSRSISMKTNSDSLRQILQHAHRAVADKIL